MSALADLTEEEKCLVALLTDISGVDQAEFLFVDETSPDSVFRCWDFQYCLSGETAMYTDRGRKPIRDLCGPVRLLTAGEGDTGRWVDASVAHFGRSQLFNINLERRGITKIIRATAGHRWFAGAGRADRRIYTEKITTELRPGDLLQPTHAPRQSFSLNADGVRAGVVFGDGTTYGSKSRVYLWGEKIKLLKWFPRSQSTPVNRPDVNVPGRYVGSLPLRYKTWTPTTWDGLGHRWGWLAGYFATDGSVDDRGTCIITSRDPDAIDTVRDIATSLGVVCSPVRQQWSEAKKPGMQFAVVLRVTDLPLDFFLLDHHRQRATIRHGGTYRAVDAWKVVDVVPGEVDETYCATVPGTHSFVLDDDILTGNSWYRDEAKLQIDQCGRSVGKSAGVQLRCFAFPFCHPGEEMLLTAPEMIHLDPVTKAVEQRLTSVRLSKEYLKTSRSSDGFTHHPFQATFRNGAKIMGRIPQKDGRGVKGVHPFKLEMDEAQDYPPAGWVELGETLKYGRAGSTWRIHGVSRGVRDDFFKKSQPGSGWKVHRKTAIHREDWSDEERRAKAEMYGSQQHPDYRRNIMGLHGDASSSLFVLTRLMARVDQDEESPYNSRTYVHMRISEERLKDSGVPITELLDIPGSHAKYGQTWIGADIGMTRHPTEILVFGEERVKVRTSMEDRFTLLTRVHLERIASPQQREVFSKLYDIYKPQALALDRTGLGLPIYQEIIQGENRGLARVVKGYNFSERIIVGWEEPEDDDGVSEAITANTLEYGSDLLRLMVDQDRLWLPWDLDLLREFQGQTYVITKSGMDSYGRKTYSKGKFHCLDAARMAALAKHQSSVESAAPTAQDEPVLDAWLES